MMRCFPAQIETKRAFQKLPWLLLTCMQTGNPIGVMIARGDLAVEIGWERLAEIQEEILWLCEAAHVPVIWATQVSFHPRMGAARLLSRCWGMLGLVQEACLDLSRFRGGKAGKM